MVQILMSNNNFLYIQLYDKFKDNIDNNIWTNGMQLPSEHDLAEKYNVSRYTIRKSLEKLEQERYISRQAGKGTFVNSKSRYKLTSLESFSEQMINMDMIPSSKVIATTLEEPDDNVKHHLNLKDNEKAFRIDRLRLADGAPMCFEIAYVSRNLCPDIDIFVDNNTSLYKLYEEHYDLKLDYGNIYLEAMICPEEYIEPLQIPPNSAVLKMECVVYVDNKEPLYFVESYYIGNKYVFFASMPRIY